MNRFRVCMLTLAAALLVAGPALAFSWPVLFGLPAVFGQEGPRAQPAKCAMPYADQKPTSCPASCNYFEIRGELLGDCLATWQKLWQQGKFREAFDLAQCAAQTAPDNLNAQHALVVSQIVNQTRPPQTVQTTRATVRVIESDEVELPACDCPLTAFFETIFGSSKTAKTSGCGVCPVMDDCCKQPADCGTAVKTQRGSRPGRNVTTQQGPAIIWILREPMTGMQPLPPLPPLPTTAGLPPPNFAPPPPPFLTPSDLPFIPLPLGELPPPPVEPQPLRVQNVLFDPAELCEATQAPMPVAMPANVRIRQHGGRVSLSSPNFDAHCERIRSSADGQMILDGSVQLKSRRHGQTLTIEAHRILLDTNDGSFVVDQGRGLQQTRMNVAPLSPTAEGLAIRKLHDRTTLLQCEHLEMPPAMVHSSKNDQCDALRADSISIVPTHRQLERELAMRKETLEVRQAERRAHAAAFEAEIKEIGAGKIVPANVLHQIQQRLARAVAQEMEAAVEFRNAMLRSGQTMPE